MPEISIHAPHPGSDFIHQTITRAQHFNPRSPNGKRPVKMDSLSHNAGTIVHSRHRSYRKPLLTLQIPSRRLQTPHNIHYEVIKQPEEQRRPSSSCHFAVRKDEYSIEALRRHQSHDIISDVHLLPCLQCLSEHHHPIDRHVSLSAAMLDLRSILRTQIVIAQTVAHLIHNLCKVMLQNQIVGRGHRAFENAVLYALPIFHAGFGHAPKTPLTVWRLSVDIISHNNHHSNTPFSYSSSTSKHEQSQNHFHINGG